MDDWNDHWMSDQERDEAVRKILHDRMMAENDWRDEGTEANRRVKKLMAVTDVLMTAVLTLLVGTGVALGAASVFHTEDHGPDRLFWTAVGILAATCIVYAAGMATLRKITAITEAG